MLVGGDVSGQYYHLFNTYSIFLSLREEYLQSRDGALSSLGALLHDVCM